VAGKGKGPSNAVKDTRDFNARLREYGRKKRRRLAAQDGSPPTPAAGGAPPPATGALPTAPAAVPAVTTETAEAQRSRYLLLEVPNFNYAEDDAEAMGSYLRLGTVPDPSIAGVWDAPRATGEDLAAFATFFLDDDRKRDGSPGFVPEAERQAETDQLHTLGGWRDHSDGNRVTTTRGDKVEVIRGNYKLVVLGRQDDGSTAAGWDVSGGHIEGLGLTSSIEWVQTFGGTWRAVETSEKGDTIATQHGNSVSFNYGEIQDSVTGSEDEMRPAMDETGKNIEVPAPNPVITSRTWARRIESYTGSAARRVPLITDETWVGKMSTSTHAGEMSDETHVDTSMSSMTISPSISSVNIGAVTDITVGNTMSMTVGAVQNITVGAMVDLTLAARLEVNMSASLDVNMGHRTELDLASKTELRPAKEEMSGLVQRTVGVEMVTAGVYKLTAGLILLG